MFTAVRFAPDVQERLAESAARLRAQSVRGRFTFQENFHLTLIFMGETPAERLTAVRRAMDAVQAGPFSLRLEGAGCFERERGALYWIGVRPNPGLDRLYASLRRQLLQAGLPVESRPYRPHITLGREVETPPAFDRTAFSRSLPELSVPVDAFTLMRSDRIEGRLRYSPLYERRLTAGERQE